MPASEKKIAITVGDPAGVGPDVIAAWAKSAPERLLARAEVLAHADFLETLPEALGKRPVGDAGFRAKAASHRLPDAKLRLSRLKARQRDAQMGVIPRS